jgi:CelD/BcsL family acetyltransferase involved in cellulose biosynthesis
MAPPALTLEPLDGLHAFRTEWEELASRSESPFATVEWAEAWLEHAADGCTPRLFAALEGGTPLAIVPLVVSRGRYVRKARFLGFGAANELGPACAPADRDRGREALRLALDETRSEWDVFLGETLPGEGWARALGVQLVGRVGSPVVAGPWASWDDYLATKSRNFRSELRRKERRLEERGLELRKVSRAEELEPALDALFELHRRRWAEDASPFFAGLESFHRAFATAAFARGWVRLRLLELEGRVVAVSYSLRFGPAEWSYQYGREPELEHESVGLILAAHAIREAFAEGAREFRLGPGLQPYKLRFATADPGLETIGLARSLRGHAALVAARRRAR